MERMLEVFELGFFRPEGSVMKPTLVFIDYLPLFGSTSFSPSSSSDGLSLITVLLTP